MAFIELMHRNKPDITNLLTYLFGAKNGPWTHHSDVSLSTPANFDIRHENENTQ